MYNARSSVEIGIDVLFITVTHDARVLHLAVNYPISVSYDKIRILLHRAPIFHPAFLCQCDTHPSFRRQRIPACCSAC